MSKEVQIHKDELDSLLEQMTLPASFPRSFVRNVLRSVLQAAPPEHRTNLAAINQVLVEALKTVKPIKAAPASGVAGAVANEFLSHFEQHKNKPHTFAMTVSAESEEKSTTFACEVALELRTMLPGTVWVLVGAVDGETYLYTVQGEKLSEAICAEASEGSIVALILGDELQLETVAVGESWEDCIKRVLPNNDKPLMLWPRPESPSGDESDKARFIIRGHDDPEHTDSEGFRYVKTYNGGRSLTWTYSAQRAKRFSYTEACHVQLLLKEVQTDSEIVQAPADCSMSELGKPCEGARVRTVTDDDWTIKKGKSGKFCISRTSDGVFLKDVHVHADSVGYEWAKTEEEATKYDSLAAANDYASEVLILQTYRGSESKTLGLKCPQESVFVLKHGSGTVPKIGRNDPCPCGSGKKWKKCCMGAK